MTTLSEIEIIIRETFMDFESPISRDTTASEVRGWTSLGHVHLISVLENQLKISLPEDRMFALKNVGELIDLVNQIEHNR